MSSVLTFSSGRSLVWVFGLAALGLLSVLPGLVLAGGQLSSDGEFIVSKDQTAEKWYTFPNGSLINFTHVPVVVKAVADVKADDVFLNLWYIKGDINKAEYLFTVANPLSTDITIKSNVFNKIERYLNISPSDIRNISAFWCAFNYPNNRTYISSYNCSSVTRNHSNGTSTVGEVCSPVYSTVTEFGNSPNNYKLFDLGEAPSLASLKMRYMLVRVEFKAGLGRRGLDWVPSLQVGSRNLTRSDWAWYNVSWSSSRSITVYNPTSETLVGFPVSVRLGNTSSWTGLSSNCSDVRVTTGDNASLVPHRVEACGSNSTVLWFNSLALNPGFNNYTLYYANPSAVDTQNGSGVFNTSFHSVYLFDGSLNDERGVSTLSTDGGTAGYDVSGNLEWRGRAVRMYGNTTSDLKAVHSNTTVATAGTISGRYYLSSGSGGMMAGLFGANPANDATFILRNSSNSYNAFVQLGSGSSASVASNITYGQLLHFAGRYDGSTLKTYDNGTLTSSGAGSGSLGYNRGGYSCLYIGYNDQGTISGADCTGSLSSANRLPSGSLVDYVFTSESARSPAWLAVEASTNASLGAESYSLLVKFVNQTPIDLNATNGIGGVNVTFNVTNKADSNNVTFYYGISPTSNTSAPFSEYYFVNGSGSGGWRKNINRVYNISAPTEAVQTWMASISDNEAYPGSYPYCPFCMINTTHTSLSVSSANEHISWLMLNISSQTGPFGFLEVMVNKSVNTPIQVRVCNASYTFSSAQDSSPNCGTVGSISNPWIPNHYHSNNSWHHVLPIAIASNSIAGVNLTPNMWFYVEGPGAGQTVTLYGLGIAPRPGSTRSSGNGGTSWTNQTFVVDSHVHQMNASMGLAYIAEANTTFGVQNSTVVFDVYNLTQFPPTGHTVLYPGFGYYTNNVSVGWSAASSPTGESVDYSVYVVNTANLSDNFTIVTGVTNFTAWFNASSILNCSNPYKIGVVARGTTSDLSNVVYGREFARACLYEPANSSNLTTYNTTFILNTPFYELETNYYSIAIAPIDTTSCITNVSDIVFGLGNVVDANTTFYMAVPNYFNRSFRACPIFATSEDGYGAYVNYTLNKYALNLTAYDIETGGLISSINYSATNSFNVVTGQSNVSPLYGYYANITTGTYNLFTVSAPSYSSTTYGVGSLNSSSHLALKAYLTNLNSTGGANILFIIKNQYLYPIPGATLQLRTNVGGTPNVLVFEGTADSSGNLYAYLIGTKTYTYTAFASGYSNATGTIAALVNPTVILLGANASGIPAITSSTGTGLIVTSYPTVSTINKTVDYGFNVSDSYCMLTSISLTLRNNLGVVVGNSSVASSGCTGGVSVSYNNTLGYYLTGTLSVMRSNGSAAYVTFWNPVGNVITGESSGILTTGSLADVGSLTENTAKDFKALTNSASMSIVYQILILLLVVVCTAMFSARFQIGSAAGAMVGVGALVFINLLTGIYPWPLIAIATMFALGAIYVQRGY